jgi:predicted nucleotidyltransferase
MGTLQTKVINQTTATAIKRFSDLVASHHIKVDQTILFGSQARGTAHELSDADVALILPGDKKPSTKIRMDLNDLAYDILLETGVIIQPIPISYSDWTHPEGYSNPRLLHNISREGVAF